MSNCSQNNDEFLDANEGCDQQKQNLPGNSDNQSADLSINATKKALIFVNGLGNENEDDAPHLYEFDGTSSDAASVPQMVDSIIQRLGLLGGNNAGGQKQFQNLNIPSFVVLKLDKEFGKFVKVDPNVCRIEHQDQFKLNFRPNIDTNKQQKQQIIVPSPFDTHIRENLEQISLTSSNRNSSDSQQSTQQIILNRTVECVEKGYKDCLKFGKFIDMMDECISRKDIGIAKRLQREWANWSKVMLEQMQRDSTNVAGPWLLYYENNAEENEKNCVEKLNMFREQTEKLVTRELVDKKNLVVELKSKDIPIIGRSIGKLAEQIEAFGKNQEKQSFVFFHEKTPMDEHEKQQQWQENYEMFAKLFYNGEQCIFVDLTVEPGDVSSKWANGQSHIAHLKGNSLITADYLATYKEQQEKEMKEFERKMNTCIVSIRDKSAMQQLNSVETNPIALELPCPLANTNGGNGEGENNDGETPQETMASCPSDDSFWECEDCGQILLLVMPKDNSPITHFHCHCGTGPITSLAFRCKNSHLHQNRFSEFDPNCLAGLLKRFEQFKEKNILILGETGVGKSTFINALGNVLNHNTLDEALQADKPICLIPAQFTLADEKMECRVIGICQHGVRLECQECKEGAKDGNGNENFVGADSCTQFPMAHVITGIKGGRLRIIDTPGIGDTRGIEQDKKNIRNILSYIATIDHIHCICILLKPNNSRLTVLFRYCIQEVLSSLHKNAAKNIVFCFTNARGTLYKPGDTLTPLNIELRELAKKTGVRIAVNSDNTYCVDNEAFRFLCAVKAGMKFLDADYKNFSESWQRSQQEFNRMLNYVTDHLEPHNTRETTSLNEARYIITTLAKPLALITRNIQSNITKMRDETERLTGLNTEANDFRTKLKIQRFYIANKRFNHPRTVCVAKEHTEVKKDEDGNKRTLYKTHCHAHCYLENVAEETYPNPALIGCLAMGGTNYCSFCGCKWDMHMHIWYEQEEMSEWVDDEEVKRMLDMNEDKKLIQEKAIENAKKRMKEWEAEQALINKLAAKAGNFLKHNSIVAINDAVEEYLKLQIKESKREADDTDKDYRRMEGLMETLSTYLEEKKILEFSMSDQNSPQQAEVLKPEHIKMFRDQLFSLKLCGKQIEELFKAEEDGRLSSRAYQENTFNRRVPNRASNNSFANYQRYQQHSSQYSSHGNWGNSSSFGNNSRRCQYGEYRGGGYGAGCSNNNNNYNASTSSNSHKNKSKWSLSWIFN